MKKRKTNVRVDRPSSRHRSGATVAPESLQDLQAQREYQDRMRLQPGSFAITVGKAFVLGMRQQGYKNTATALDELIDNAMQAGAKRIDVVFGFEGAVKSNQPTAIAVIDDGHGMDPTMIRLSMTWGGSHRADRGDRSGFGRFGFGLPSAALSQSEAYTVISRTQGKQLREVRFDIERLSNYVGVNGSLEVEGDRPAHLPTWLRTHVDKEFDGLAHGTIVLLDRLDNHRWKTLGALQENLSRHIGMYYRRFLADLQLRVNGEPVTPIDPLFLMEDGRFYDSADGLRAEAWPSTKIVVRDRDTNTTKGIVEVRYSFMPYRFAAGTDYDPDGTEEEKRVKSGRFQILKETAGLIFMRHGRQIGVLDPPRRTSDGGWFDMIPADIHWACEINFPASLDEEFGITTSKQGAHPTERMWELLKQHDVAKTCLQMRYDRRSQVSASRKSAGPETTVEQVMSKIAPHKRRRFLSDDIERINESNIRLKNEISRLANQTKLDARIIADQLAEEIARRPYVVEREAGNEGPFYRLETRGPQRRLILNSDHPFCQFYDSVDDQMKLMALLLLYIIADAELDADSGLEKKKFYIQERAYWSNNLRLALEQIKSDAYSVAEPSEPAAS